MSIPAITAALAATKGLKRKFSRCGEEQMVPREEKDGTVPCKSCGGPLPPPKPQKTYE